MARGRVSGKSGPEASPQAQRLTMRAASKSKNFAKRLCFFALVCDWRAGGADGERQAGVSEARAALQCSVPTVCALPACPKDGASEREVNGLSLRRNAAASACRSVRLASNPNGSKPFKKGKKREYQMD